jgi:hypothetical protein
MNPTDFTLAEMRDLAARLIAANDDNADDAAAQGCRLAALFLDQFDAAIAEAAARSPAPLGAISAVVAYVDEAERADYRAAAERDRPHHIYRYVRHLQQWLTLVNGRQRKQPTLRAFLHKHGLDPDTYPERWPVGDEQSLLAQRIVQVVDGPNETRAIFLEEGGVIVETRWGSHFVS